MKLIKASALLAIGAAFTMACAVETDDGSGGGTGGGFNPVGSGGGVGTGTGGDVSTATGGAVGATGGAVGATGGAVGATGGATSSGPTYLSGADAGLSTLGVSVAVDKGGSSATMSKGTNPGEVCFTGSTPAVTDWGTQWGVSITFDLAAADMSYDGSSSTNLTYSLSGTAPGMTIGLVDATNTYGTDKVFFKTAGAVGTGTSVAISTLDYAQWIKDAEAPKMPPQTFALDKTKLTGLVVSIESNVAAQSFNFCITDPKIDGYVAPAM